MKPLLLTLLIGLAAVSGTLAQTVPPLMNYQGRLTDEAGAPLANGVYRLAFRLYSQPVGGSAVWEEEQNVSLLQGGFNVILGSVNTALTNAFNEPNRYLELQVVRDAANATVNRTILPRQQLLSTPYAFMASRLIKDLQDALCPPGTIVAFGGPNAKIPQGWFLCDGTPRRIQDFPALYQAIGTNWGNGTTTLPAPPGDGPDLPAYAEHTGFNLPDLRGLFLRGASIGPFRQYVVDGKTNTIDPERLSPIRIPIKKGGNTHGAEVGSLQLDATRAIPDVWLWAGTETTDGFTPGVYYDNRGSTQTRPVGWPQGSETRPVNAYVHYIIKY